MKTSPWWQVVTILALAVLPAVGTAWLHPKRPAWELETLAPGEIRLADAQQLPNLVWIDARPQAAYQAAHIPGAISLNEDEWNTLLPPFALQWRPEQNVVVYCDSLECNSSHAVAERLRKELGMEKVLVLKGGWKSWQTASGK